MISRKSGMLLGFGGALLGCALFLQSLNSEQLGAPIATYEKSAAQPAPVEPASVPAGRDAGPTGVPRIDPDFGRVPLSFEANHGQTAESVKFLARGPGYTLFMTPEEVVLALRSADERQSNLRLQLEGAAASPRIVGLDELSRMSSYFIGNDPTRWRTSVPHYARVKYEQVYPGVDVIYYSSRQQLEYDFILAPGRKPESIKLSFGGARKLEVELDGSLRIETLSGQVVRQQAPIAYQESNGTRQTLHSSYVLLSDNGVGFAVADYDTALPLVIDPILIYSTFLGGSDVDIARSVAIDSSGAAYVAGDTSSVDFPVSGAYQSTNRGGTDAMVAKYNPAGALVYATYLGGGGTETAYNVAVDASGNAFVTGETLSADFPTLGAFQAAYGGLGDAFVAKLNAAGNGLLYSSYLGGAAEDIASSIVMDSASGGFVVAGSTRSANFPVSAGAFQNTSAGDMDGFVTKFNAAGSALAYSTYLGGLAGDAVFGLTLDASGNAYLSGGTTSANFPTLNAFQATRNGVVGEAFVTRLNASGGLLSSTFLGGTGDDTAATIDLDGAGNIYICGYTQSADFPVVNAHQATMSNSAENAFAAKFNPAASALLYSTYIGGNNQDRAVGIAVDAAGYAYVTGRTRSQGGFPLVNPLQPAFGGGLTDAFLFKLDPAGSLVFSTYFGGNDIDDICNLAIDNENDAFLVGGTLSANFPTLNAAQPTPGANRNGFLTKIDTTVPPLITSALTATATRNQPFTYTLTASGSVPMTLTATNLPPGVAFSGGVISGTPTAAGLIDILLSASNKAGTDNKALLLTINREPGTEGNNTAPVFSSPPTVSANPATAGESVTFTASAADADGDVLAYSWNFGDGTTGAGPSVNHIYTAPGLYTVTVTANDGLATDTTETVVAVNGNTPGVDFSKFSVGKVSLKFNFSRAASDSFTVAGTFPVPPNFDPNGKTMVVAAGGLMSTFTITAKGSAKSGADAVKFSGKKKKGIFTASPLKFSYAAKNRDLFANLSSFGFTNADVGKPGTQIKLKVLMGLDGTFLLGEPMLGYTAKKDKSGLAVKKK